MMWYNRELQWHSTMRAALLACQAELGQPNAFMVGERVTANRLLCRGHAIATAHKGATGVRRAETIWKMARDAWQRGETVLGARVVKIGGVDVGVMLRTLAADSKREKELWMPIPPPVSPATCF